MNRITSVVRMQLVNRQTYLWTPLIILVGSLVVSLAIYALLRANVPTQEAFFGGGAQAPLWYFLGIGVSAMSYTFPFSQAMSVTRREFFLGTMLTAFGVAVILGTIFTVGGVIEQATGGFGLDGYFFRLPWIWESGLFVAWLFWVIIAMVFFVIGFWFATVYTRFSTVGLTTAFIALALVIVGAAALITWQQAWASVWEFIVNGGPLGLTGVAAVVLVALSFSSYATLRRATP